MLCLCAAGNRAWPTAWPTAWPMDQYCHVAYLYTTKSSDAEGKGARQRGELLVCREPTARDRESATANERSLTCGDEIRPGYDIRP